MMKRFFLVDLLFCISFLGVYATLPASHSIVFYNVENLFKPTFHNDSLRVDSTGLAQKGWHYGRYRDKLFHLAQVFVAIGGWTPPLFIGVCEIGSADVLTDLLHISSLKQLGYDVIHYESADVRGSDVALFFRKQLVKLLYSKSIKVPLATSVGAYSRDILYCETVVNDRDTLHLFVCHFPSRRGGNVPSEKNRMVAAAILRSQLDSIMQVSPHANIFVMGDFNDYPTDISLTDVLQAKPIHAQTLCQSNGLYNLCDSLHRYSKLGSYKHEHYWGMFDQFLLSGAMFLSERWCFSQRQAELFAPNWLLMSHQTYGGVRPFSTYYGWQYLGGYSDHLPIVLRFMQR